MKSKLKQQIFISLTSIILGIISGLLYYKNYDSTNPYPFIILIGSFLYLFVISWFSFFISTFKNKKNFKEPKFFEVEIIYIIISIIILTLIGLEIFISMKTITGWDLLFVIIFSYLGINSIITSIVIIIIFMIVKKIIIKNLKKHSLL